MQLQLHSHPHRHRHHILINVICILNINNLVSLWVGKAVQFVELKCRETWPPEHRQAVATANVDAIVECVAASATTGGKM